MLVLAVVLSSFVRPACGPQLPWLLDPPLRCLVPLRVLESIGAELPILGLGACRVIV
jgi:hypothetical protein